MNAPRAAIPELPNECELALAESMPATLYPEIWREIRRAGIGLFDSDDPFDFLQAEPVVFLPNDRFEFARNLRDAAGAEIAALIPCRDESGDITDIAAWELTSDKTALWRGAVGMLGEDNLEPRLDEPLLVHETVTGWLRHGRRGIFILDYFHAAYVFLATFPTLGVQDERFGRKLRETLTIQAPPIRVAAKARAAA